MDTRSGLRTVIAALVTIGVIVLLFVLIVKGFSGGGPAKPLIDITKYQDESATATILIDGPTNLDQDHRQLRISVSGTQNTVDLIQGYQGSVIDTHSYPNNTAAFGVFLQSLKLMNFAKGDKTPSDYRGYCPAGQRYVYTFNDGTKDLFKYWSTSCGQGTFGGNRAGVRQLFERQIPETDLDKLASDLSL